jgi:hypothetical protein
MVCPNCSSKTLEHQTHGSNPVGPLLHVVVLHFECTACRHRFYRANPELARPRVRARQQTGCRRDAA